MNTMNKRLLDIISTMRTGVVIPHRHDEELLDFYAGKLEAAWKAEAAEIVQIIQDAIGSYESAYPDAPNDDAEFYIKHQVAVANDWLAAHGFARINVKLDKEEEPW